VVGPPSGYRIAMPERDMPSEAPQSHQVSGCLARLFWMLVGNLILPLATIGIGENRAGFTLTGRDFFYWAVALSLVAVRYVDIRCLDGRTADNRPANVRLGALCRNGSRHLPSGVVSGPRNSLA
jgi:hypothetical protein